MDVVVHFLTRYPDATPLSGTVRVYTDAELVQVIPTDESGAANALLTDGQQYNVAFATAAHVYVETVTITAEAGAVFTLWAAPRTIAAPDGMCVVRGRAVGPTGRPTRRLRMSFALIGGDVAVGDDVILNDGERVPADETGSVETTLYRGRVYRATLTGVDEYAAFDSFVIYAPDRPFARLADLLYPSAISISPVDVVAPGDYPLTVQMTDGRSLTQYIDVTQYIRVAGSGDVTASLQSVSGVAHLRVSGDMTDWSVLIYGRPVQFRRGPDVWDTARGDGESVIATIEG